MQMVDVYDDVIIEKKAGEEIVVKADAAVLSNGKDNLAYKMRNEQRNNEEVEIDLRQIFSVILSKIVVIILVGVIFGLVALIGSKMLIKPTYESTTSLYVLNRQSQGTTTYSDLQSSTQLTQDYVVLVTSRSVIEKVISELKLDMTNEELVKMINVNTPTNTRVLEITVSSHDQKQAKEIADKLAEVSADSIGEIMQTEKVTRIDAAQLPDKPVSPNVIQNGIIAGILGIIIAMAVVVVKFVMNDRINTSEDVEKYLGISTLALIPLSDELDDSKDVPSSRNKGKKSKKSSKKGAR